MLRFVAVPILHNFSQPESHRLTYLSPAIFTVPDPSSTANEGPMRIQFKCLVPIYVFPEMKLCSLFISITELECSVSQFLHSSSCDRFIYFQDWSFYFDAAKYVDRSCEYINHSQTHECRNWD
jgi:hypothetical protein